MFGRRKTPPTPPQQPPGGDKPGHAHVLAHLDREEADKPYQRTQLVGNILFETTQEAVAQDGRIRVENVIVTLASIGGQQCLAPLLQRLAEEGKQPQDVGMTVLKGDDGHLYFFGDLPNQMLAEKQTSLISLAFGAAAQIGAKVSVEMIMQEMKTVARKAGTGDGFLELDLPPQHQVDSPLDIVAAFGPRLVEICDLYRVPPLDRQVAFGFALQRVLTMTKGVIDPDLAVSIILQAAVRASKIDPNRVAQRRSEMLR